ncbi:type II CAAX prenyl endopeptidase Rce1 family protein [Dyadobacter sp. LHD-138]|uniref:CPBP family glutamic-type intramembrane protease n=1 Tax=Dyadobacter sp. LHD-138 TaxID=3071413 RepID=UPI0027E212C5|nr:CPBP family glutamic-type intramembrane protease [Dyadobacter sp. LHD-138]MDQ6477421.1 CPBP family glutamic-type intramembrane protease [Dyadobacter sp. LHD-138]
MKYTIRDINYFILSVSNGGFVTISLSIEIVSRFIFNNLIFLVLQQENVLVNPVIEGQNIYIKLIMSLILAPIIETFIFFLLPFKTLKYFKWQYLSFSKCFVLIASILFAFNHCFNFVYFLSSCFGGVLMAIFYLISDKRAENSYLNTTILHSLYNAFVILFNYF